MRYRFTVPPTAEQGSYVSTCSTSYTETYRQNALADYNSCRAHDGLPPTKRMPAGTTYTAIVEYVLQGNYGHGFEDLCAEDSMKAVREQLKCYRENEGGNYRIVRRAV